MEPTLMGATETMKYSNQLLVILKREYFDVEEQEFYSCDLYDGYHNPDFQKGRV